MEKKLPNLAIVCLRAKSGSLDPQASLSLIDSFEAQMLLRCPNRAVVRIQDGVLLVDQDACFPALVYLFQNMRDDQLELCVLEIGESPAILSRYRDDVELFLQGMGRKTRWTYLPNVL
jgi:hypothetical protein